MPYWTWEIGFFSVPRQLSKNKISVGKTLLWWTRNIALQSVFCSEIIWMILTDPYPDPYRISHINYTPLFIHKGLLPSSLRIILLLSYLYCRESLDLSPRGAILTALYWEREHFLIRDICHLFRSGSDTAFQQCPKFCNEAASPSWSSQLHRN